MASRYEIAIFWSDDDCAYIAEVVDLPGCTADGRTYQEALAGAEVAIDEWIETARDAGLRVPPPRPHRPSLAR